MTKKKVGEMGKRSQVESGKKSVRKKEEKSKLILLPDSTSRLLFIDLSFQTGAVADPNGASGTASLALSMLLRGTKKRNAAKFHEELDRLGAEIYLAKNMESLRIMGETLVDNVEPFFDLLEEMIREPAFAPEEFAKLQAQTLSVLQDELSSDGDIAERRFQEYCLLGHPYGRVSSGSLSSVEKLRVQDLEKFFKQNLHRGIAVFAATGGLSEAKMAAFGERLLKALPAQGNTAPRVEEPVFSPGRRLLMLDKADRTQSQIFVGSPGVSQHHPDYYALAVGMHVFGGGSFSAWLMKEVREKRGWSYGAYGGFRAARKPLYFSMHTTPSNKDTGPALQLMVQLLEKLHKEGISEAEFEFAKRSLVNQSAFLQDTLSKRLNNKVNEILLGLKPGFYDSYQSELKRVRFAETQKALKKHIDPTRLFMMVLGSVDTWRQGVEAVPGVREKQVLPFDREPSAR